MQLEDRIFAIARLGEYMGAITDSEHPDHSLLLKAHQHNGWFTHDNLVFALNSWSKVLSVPNLTNWLSAYDFSATDQKTIGIVMAGNIPLVGFHDFISVLLSGHKVLAKLSSNDGVLLPHLSQTLIGIESRFEGLIGFPKDRLTDFDAVIATGSNNTARHFEYYFGKHPNIIRSNRNGVAILNGKERLDQLESLADDIFRYFGLGCRNVSKLYVPNGYNFDTFFNAMYRWRDIINNDKYINNYDYNKAVYLMSNMALLDNEFMLLKEDQGYASPISVVFYEYYSNETELLQRLERDAGSIQCIVGDATPLQTIPFGGAQTPGLPDYADGVDTMAFLTEL